MTGKLNGHDYVDLGLPSGTLWATCNVGASKPKDGGYYFAWGETSPKRNYEYDNYKHYKGDGRQITKYCTKSNYGNNGIVDNLTNLQLSDDAATINWGSNWRMPTKSEMIELYEKCRWEWTDGGYVISGPNGNTIFLPAAGGVYENEYYPVSVYGGYWSNSLDIDRPDGSFGVFFGMYRINLTYGDRIMGSSIRPVHKPSEIEKNNKSAITSLNKESFKGSESKTEIESLLNKVIEKEDSHTIYYEADEKLDIKWIDKNCVSHYFSNGKGKIRLKDDVTGIGFDAFYGCIGLTAINIPDSVSGIGWGAFGCSGLTSINIPDSVTGIGPNAFSGCSGLTSINIPDSVTEIGEYAFYRCSGLTSINIPNLVKVIGKYAFEGCSGLTSIVVARENGKYDSRNNCNAIIETATNTLVTGCTNTVIPDSVTEIGGSAFSGCSGLTSINIPDSVTEIGWKAFKGCSGLTSIVVAKGNGKYDSRNNCNAIIETATNTLVCGCMNTTIPDSVMGIGKFAFEGCSGLTSINIPDSVKVIGKHAFEGCSGLTSIVVAKGNGKYDSRNNCNAIIETATNKLVTGCMNTVIPDSVKVIGESAFDSGLVSINIPDSVIEIGWDAFSVAKNLQKKV